MGGRDSGKTCRPRRLPYRPMRPSLRSLLAQRASLLLARSTGHQGCPYGASGIGHREARVPRSPAGDKGAQLWGP
eukprot:3671649-Pyramimonas_sp.AAC.1